MKIYLISQNQNAGYDAYDSAVVAAPDEETARNMSPCFGTEIDWTDRYISYGTWCTSLSM